VDKIMLLNDLTHEYILSRFHYNEISGDLSWKNGRNEGQLVGSVFVAQHGKLYWRTKVASRALFNHRIAWFIKTETCPEKIDHWNGDGLDNAWINLREATQAQNFANNDNLIRGIDAFPNGKWRAKITLDRQQIHLGMFETKEEAFEAYKQALVNIHGEYAVYNRR